MGLNFGLYTVPVLRSFVLHDVRLSDVSHNNHTTPNPTFFLFLVTLYPSMMKFASIDEV
jgi:hypothetical protein